MHTQQLASFPAKVICNVKRVKVNNTSDTRLFIAGTCSPLYPFIVDLAGVLLFDLNFVINNIAVDGMMLCKLMCYIVKQSLCCKSKNLAT